jgi:hypothetical protein
MWDHLTPQSIMDLQRKAALQHMGEEAKRLLDEGYSADADRILDEMLARFDFTRHD